MRARQPDDRGFVERDGVGLHWERFGDGEPTDRCCSRRGRSSRRGTGRRRCRTWPAGTAWSRSTAAAPAAPTDPSVPTPTRIDEFAADTLAVLDATGTERAVLVGLSRGAPVGVSARGRPSRPRARPRRHRPGGAAGATDPERAGAPVRRAARRRPRVGRKYNSHALAPRLRGLPRVLLRPDVPRAALDQADRGLRRLGPRDRRQRRWSTPSTGLRRAASTELRRACAAGSAARCS